MPSLRSNVAAQLNHKSYENVKIYRHIYLDGNEFFFL